MNTHVLHRLSPLAQRRVGGAPLGSLILSLISLLRQRHALSKLDDRLLQDIGVTRAEAEAESTRPVWDVPAHWR